MAVPARGQPEQVGRPVEHQALELGRRRRGPPQERDRVERGREQLGQDSRLRRARREVREVARVLPVGDARQQDLVEVAEHRGERLGLFRRACAEGARGSPRA